MKDYLLEQMIDMEGIDILFEENNHYTFEHCTDKWEMKNGQKIKPKDMTTIHLINSINMVRRICKDEGMCPDNYMIFGKMCDELNKRKGDNEKQNKRAYNTILQRLQAIKNKINIY